MPLPQVPQAGISSGQLIQFSPEASISSPQKEVHVPTSCGQFLQFSPGSIIQSPHDAGISIQSLTSCGQVLHVSHAFIIPLPHNPPVPVPPQVP